MADVSDLELKSNLLYTSQSAGVEVVGFLPRIRSEVGISIRHWEPSTINDRNEKQSSDLLEVGLGLEYPISRGARQATEQGRRKDAGNVGGNLNSLLGTELTKQQQTVRST